MAKTSAIAKSRLAIDNLSIDPICQLLNCQSVDLPIDRLSIGSIEQLPIVNHDLAIGDVFAIADYRLSIIDECQDVIQ